METKHTPGPWALETVPTTCGVCHKVGPFPGKRPVDKPRYACLYADYPSKGNQPDDELEANARLIVSAPELYDVLREVFEYLDAIPESAAGGDDDAVRLGRKARAALDMAEGK